MKGPVPVIWRAKFYGAHSTITVDKKSEKAIIEKDGDGK
jgi:hypothetical protein